MPDAESASTTKSKTVSRTFVFAILTIVCAVGAAVILIYTLDDCSFSRCAPTPLPEQVIASPKPTTSTDEYFFKNAIVTVDNGRCSEVGREILQAGGSAVDGAIASLLCNGIINTHSHGLGGGHFMVIYDRTTGEVEAIDAREEAPAAAYETMFTDNPREDASTFGGLAIGVPGEVEGFWTAHLKHGKLPWKDLFEPAIKIAEGGVQIDGALAGAIRSKETEIRMLPELGEVFLKNDGTLKQEGDIMFRPKLAHTYRRIAAGGAEVFYTGRLADDIVADIKDYGGIITMEDMRNYRAKFREPVKVQIDGLTAYSLPPPSSGAVMTLIMNILKGFNVSEDSINDDLSKILTFHRIVEAFKFAYAKRTLLGDEDFANVTEIVANMTSPEYAESLRQKIHDNRTYDYLYYGPSFSLTEDAGTSHMGIVDKDGNAVAVSSTINL